MTENNKKSESAKKVAETEKKVSVLTPAKTVEKAREFIIDEQTGRSFEVKPEDKMDRLAARASIIYLLIMIFFFLWQLFDIWLGRFTLAQLFGYLNYGPLTNSSTLIGIYTFIGGALGGIVNEIRGFLFWHCDHNAFGRRYLWKALVSPWLGAVLGIFVYFFMRSGIALFSGEFIPGEGTVQQAIPMFTIGLLAGYGSRKVFIWLDHHVDRIFKLKKKKDEAENLKKVPNLKGMTKEEAEKKLDDFELKLGKVKEVQTEKKDMIKKVISQDTKPNLYVEAGSAINITLGVRE